jgi:hypothetical protein
MKARIVNKVTNNYQAFGDYVLSGIEQTRPETRRGWLLRLTFDSWSAETRIPVQLYKALKAGNLSFVSEDTNNEPTQH